MSDLYVVSERRGCGCGAGMFVVVETASGTEVGAHKYWRDEAEQLARRLNAQARRELDVPGERT